MNSLFKKIHGDSFKGIGYSGYLILADKTISEPITKAVYENYQVGMAEHLYEAMIIFADKELKKNVEEYKKLKKILGSIIVENILDIGCGEGLTSIALKLTLV